MNDLHKRAFSSSLFGALSMAALLFLPAGTFDFWQAWMFMGVFVGASAILTVYLAVESPQLLKRRMKVGPRAEEEKTQKIAVRLVMLGFMMLLLIPALDRRLGWSAVPRYVSLIGDALIALAFVLFFLVFRANPYSASTVQVSQDQTVVSAGPYAVVRHPMYAGALILMVGTPLALGSWWGLLGMLVMIPALVWRLLDEERFLNDRLMGYAHYMQTVRYRLVPLVW